MALMKRLRVQIGARDSDGFSSFNIVDLAELLLFTPTALSIKWGE
jgi:hypothetical protein